MHAFTRPAVGFALLVGAASPFVLLSHRAAPPVLSTVAINGIHPDALTALKVTTAAPIQGTRPIVIQRGTGIDGRLRSAPAENMAIGANPFEDVWRAPTVGGIDLVTGNYSVQDTDIALPAAGFPWIIGRSYNSRQESSGSHYDSDGVNGADFFQSSQPAIAFYDDASNIKDMVYLQFRGDSFAEYKRVDSTGPTFKGVNGAAGVFKFVAGTSPQPDTYTLNDQNGNELVFFGFDTNAGVAAGQLWKITDTAGNVAYVGNSSTASTAISSGFDGSGRMTTAYDTSGRRYSYAYSQLNSAYRLTQVKAEKNTGSWVMVAQVDYDYYGSGETYGSVGDLKTVTITTPLTDSGVNQTKRKYYRYWSGTYNSSTNPGYPHQIQYIVDFEGVRKFDWADSTFDDDELTATESNLKPYASAYFEYDSSYRIRKAWFNGQCGCSGASNGTYEFTYESNGSYTDNSGYDTAWCTRTIVKRPDLSYMTQYWDEIGQPLSQVITDIDPASSSPTPKKWVTRVVRDSSGFVTTIATPANCSSYTHSTGSISGSSSVGLIWDFTRPSTGPMTGFLTVKKYKVGTSGTLYYASESGYTQNDKVIVSSGNPGATEVIRPLISSGTRYPQITTTSSNTYQYGHTVTFDGTSVLAVASDQVTEPAVTTGNNGSGTANSGTQYYTVDGKPSYRKARDGILSYRAYTDGQVTTSIEDADTAILSDEPAGLSSTGTPFHRITTYAYDNQGRIDVVTQPDGRKIKHYYSKLGDGRAVELVYNDYEVTPKFYGPVQYGVRNLSGNVEVQATVALTNNESTTALTGHVDETDADPITAMDLGTVAKLSTQIYDSAGGTVQESRSYFLVPASGAGTDGMNYDATTYAYDDNGRRVRTEDPTGTVTRTGLDLLGRVTGRWTGTNDNSGAFPGGDTTGTEDMVQTEALVYDGGSDNGNGYLTSRTLYVEGSSTGQRVTTYSNDAFGHVLLQTNPTAPHFFNKYDNEGRLIANGTFSSTGSIVVGTDDPTTEATNRLALFETAYNEIGQRWKATRHNIGASGSDDDTLLNSMWYDAEGASSRRTGRS